MKNVANYISVSRIIMSIILYVTETFSIALIKVTNAICAYICYKKLVLPHTIANKIIGFILFIAPFIIVNTNSIIFEIIICSIATFAAVQEGHYIRTRNYNS